MQVIIPVALSVLVVVLSLSVLPRILEGYGAKPKKHTWLIVAGLLLYVISWWLPSPLIEGRDTSLTTHFIGGGLFTGFVWLYVKRSFRWKSSWWFEGLTLFALVSSLGVINELAEIVFYACGYMPYGISDTSWDLLANSLGSFVFFLLYVAFLKRHYSSAVSIEG